jgi:hypothetical protein
MNNGGCGTDFRLGGFGASCSGGQGSLFGSGASQTKLSNTLQGHSPRVVMLLSLLRLIVCNGLVGWNNPRGLTTDPINTLPQHYSHEGSLTCPGTIGRQLHSKQSMCDSSPAPKTAVSGLGGGGAGWSPQRSGLQLLGVLGPR